MIYRVIDKESGLFLRDDFTFDEETEIGLDVEPAQGLYQHKWDGSQWIEGATPDEIALIQTPTGTEPSSLEERVETIERNQEEITTILADIAGVTL